MEISMNLFSLRYFVTLARVQHYTRAAEQLCITQPSLSYAVSQLEKELGVPLFEKSGRNTSLTSFGEEFLVCAENTLRTLDEGVASIQRAARGEGLVRIGMIRPLGIEYVPGLVKDFWKTVPSKEVQFTFHTDVTAPLLAGLKERRFDLLFCSKPPEGEGFAAVPVKKQRLVLVVPKGHAFAGRRSIRLEETLEEPYVYFDKNSGIRFVIDEMFEKTGGQPRIAYETEEDQVIAGMVAKGFGIAIVPYMELLERLDVEVLEISSPAYERNFYLVTEEKRYLAPAVQRFYEFVMETLTE